MVYTGRPSTGCARCRERRKKCDETRPACMNCVKLGRECPGFPDQLDLMFKNETANVTEKATRGPRSSAYRLPSALKGPFKATNSKVAVEPGVGSGPSRESSGDSDGLQDANVRNPSQEWMNAWEPFANLAVSPASDLQLRTSFFYNMALQPRQSEGARDNPAAAVAQSFQDTSFRSPLYALTEAIAIRTVAPHSNYDDLGLHADRLYEAALGSVHGAVGRSEDTEMQEAVLSVLLFTLYECVASSSTQHEMLFQSAAATSQDTNDQAQSALVQLFHSNRAFMFSNNPRRRAVLEELSAADQLREGGSRQAADFCPIDSLIQMPDVLATATELLLIARPRTHDTVRLVENLLQEAYNLQNELYRWDMNMPLQFGYSAAPQTRSLPNADMLAMSDVWPGSVHIYKDVHNASIRNNNRVSQLLCSGVVMEALKWLEPEDYAEDRRYKAAEYRVQYLVDDIAASVPFHFGYGADSNSKAVMDRSSMVKSNGIFLVWPLYVASQTASIPMLQRKWLVGKLDEILHHYGLERADNPA